MRGMVPVDQAGAPRGMAPANQAEAPRTGAVTRLQVAALRLLALDGLEEGLEVADAEAA
jgi:hypothetical protein